MRHEAITWFLDGLTRSEPLQMPQEQVVIERCRLVIVGQDPLLECHVGLIPVVRVLIQDHRAGIRVKQCQAPREGGFPSSRAASDSDDERLAKDFGRHGYLIRCGGVEAAAAACPGEPGSAKQHSSGPPKAGQGAQRLRDQTRAAKVGHAGGLGIFVRQNIIKPAMDERIRLTAMVKAAG
jgi:hypothetical protein